MTNSYQAKNIQVLEGLDAVRMRPGMYIGTTGSKGMHHLLWEIVDNSIDECANGFGDKIIITLLKGGAISVEDNGRGIPVDLHPTLKVPGVQVVFTKLHAGGKFSDENYNYSGGLHGVGASVVNALSKYLNVEVYKNGNIHRIEFNSVKIPQSRKVQSGILKTPLFNAGKTDKKQGTFVEFLPDDSIFESNEFSTEVISKRLKEFAFLNKGVSFVLIDKRGAEPTEKVYKYDGGLKDFVVYLNESKKTQHAPIYLEGARDNISIQLAIQYNDSYTEGIFSYVNNVNTSEGGTHETGLKSALTKCFNEYLRDKNFLKDKDQNLMGEDFREGITAVLSLKMKNAQFEGQTKTKLGNPEIRGIVEDIVLEQMSLFLSEKKNDIVGQVIAEKSIAAAKVREAARKAKEITRAKNSIENASLVGKLSSCSGRKPELNELFIVEGDSAGGSAKQARERSFQAILPLRGKPLNAEKKRIDQVLSNEEIRTIISALGTGIGQDFELEDLNYHKVVILSDADQDGAHIRAILLTFFFRYMKELISNGHLFIGLPPLYKVYKKDELVYAYSDNELKSAIDKIGRGYSIQRYKGLGEMNPEQLWDTTINPKTRTLMQVTIEDAADAEKLITTLMGDAIEARKAYINEYANFNKKDEFKNLTLKNIG